LLLSMIPGCISASKKKFNLGKEHQKTNESHSSASYRQEGLDANSVQSQYLRVKGRLTELKWTLIKRFRDHDLYSIDRRV
jgi:hypothetical protein